MDQRREALWEYLRGALWVLPTASVVLALGLGSALSKIDIAQHSVLHRLVFEGTADDARTLLIGIAGTMITVIALMLGLTVVALQLSSTQFSPRLLRNFLRDRPNQLVLSSFVATFAYSTAGLYTVGVSGGARTHDFPRLAVSGAIVLLFLSLFALVYEVHHVAHSMQVDEIMRAVEEQTQQVIRATTVLPCEGPPPTIPAHATAIRARRSGYVQTIHPEALTELATRTPACAAVAHRLGEHIVAGAPIAWIWHPDGTEIDPEPAAAAAHRSVRLGFERTLEQDAALGLRQLVDIASKALSPAVNDPYTAVQAIDHLAVIMASLARREHGTTVYLTQAATSVTVPGYSFADYLDLSCAQIRRFGSSEPTIARELVELLSSTAHNTDRPDRHAAILAELDLIVAAAERDVVQREDLNTVRLAEQALRAQLTDQTAAGESTDRAPATNTPMPKS